ncbi:MAG: hypothetical protein JO100_12685 [Pseudonocardia sp.]|nr:hypothetical protein [Pseudonocardia sp.]
MITLTDLPLVMTASASGNPAAEILLLGLAFFAGMGAGVSLAELNLRARERRLAEGRRRLRQAMNASRVASEVDRVIMRSADRLRRDANTDADWLALAEELNDLTIEPPPDRSAA